MLKEKDKFYLSALISGADWGVRFWVALVDVNAVEGTIENGDVGPVVGDPRVVPHQVLDGEEDVAVVLFLQRLVRAAASSSASTTALFFLKNNFRWLSKIIALYFRYQQTPFA